MHTLLNQYWDYLRIERQVSPHTLTNYQHQLDAILTILAEKGNAVTGRDVTSLLNFTNSDVSIAKGDVESYGSINLKESNVTLSETSKFFASKVKAANASIVFNQVAADVVKVDTVTDNSSIKVVAGSNITAQYGSAEAVLQALEEAGAVSGKAKDTLTANLAG